MTIIRIIRYEIDPFQREGFKKHAENLIGIIPRCGGHLIGFFLPYEGTNNVARGLQAVSKPPFVSPKLLILIRLDEVLKLSLVAFDSLASYEAYKTRLKSDPKAREDAVMMQTERIILREERNFVEVVDGTFNLPSTLLGPT
jgi:hypothetical protein